MNKLEPLYVFATEDEATWFKKNGYEYKNYVVTEIGAVNVIEKLRNINRNTPIINLGFAGSYFYPKGSFVSIRYAKQSNEYINYQTPIYDLGGDGEATCISYGDFSKAKFVENEKTVFDMELVFILALGFSNVKAIKYVSDNSNPEEYFETLSL